MLHLVILCGDSGTRLRSLSSETRLERVVAREDRKTLFKAVLRCAGLSLTGAER